MLFSRRSRVLWWSFYVIFLIFSSRGSLMKFVLFREFQQIRTEKYIFLGSESSEISNEWMHRSIIVSNTMYNNHNHTNSNIQSTSWASLLAVNRDMVVAALLLQYSDVGCCCFFNRIAVIDMNRGFSERMFWNISVLLRYVANPIGENSIIRIMSLSCHFSLLCQIMGCDVVNRI